MEKFASIYQRAAERKGGEQALESLLNRPLAKQQLLQITDDRWLSAFTMKVFQCGISWRVVRNKWPNFEQAFFEFHIPSLLMLSEEQWEQKAKDPKIIRHLTKVMSIATNAQMILSTRYNHPSFSSMVANWPSEDIIGLWLYLKKHGSRLGGNTGPYTLRQMGVDTFLLSSDVEAYLRNTGIIDSGRATKRAMIATNSAFVDWQQQSGRSFTEISQTIALSCGDNSVI